MVKTRIGRKMKTIDTENIKFSIGDDQILYIECLPDTIMTLDEGKLSTKTGLTLTEGKAMPLLCDLKNVAKMTQECRRYFAGPEHAKMFTKCALLITNPISRIIGNFFLGANKPLKPTKLFTNKEEALKWLLK